MDRRRSNRLSRSSEHSSPSQSQTSAVGVIAFGFWSTARLRRQSRMTSRTSSGACPQHVVGEDCLKTLMGAAVCSRTGSVVTLQSATVFNPLSSAHRRTPRLLRCGWRMQQRGEAAQPQHHEGQGPQQGQQAQPQGAAAVLNGVVVIGPGWLHGFEGRGAQRLRRCICQVTSVPTGLQSRKGISSSAAAGDSGRTSSARAIPQPQPASPMAVPLASRRVRQISQV